MYPVDRDRTKPRVCRSQGGKKDVGGEVGISADVSGKEDTRMFENHEQDSTASRVRNARSQIRDMIILRWQYKVKNMQSKRLPAVVDMAVWKKSRNDNLCGGIEKSKEYGWKYNQIKTKYYP